MAPTLRLLIMAFAAMAVVAACAHTRSKMTKHADGTVETEVETTQLGTGHEATAEIGEDLDPDTGKSKLKSTATTRDRPPTKIELDAERLARQNAWLFWLGIGLIAFCALGWGAKLASFSASVSMPVVGALISAIGSMPTWILNLAGVGGAAAFSWTMLDRQWQLYIAAGVILGIVLTGYFSWKSSHAGRKARLAVKVGENG